MCGRASLAVDPDELRDAFDLEQVPPVMPPRYNIAPTQPLAVIREPRRLELFRWGLPSTRGGPGINVRVETIARAPAYREAFFTRRCLVLVTGFYEWQKTGKTKQPFAVRRGDGKPFALAGIWASSTTTDGEIIDACAVVTGEATGVLAPLHDRMPLIVPREGYARWLAHDARTPELQKLMTTEAGSLVAYPVSTFVNVAANDDVRCLAPLAT